MWYPLSLDQVDRSFPLIKEQVLKRQLKSRGKNKNHSDDEYVWEISFCVCFSDNTPDNGFILPCLMRRWKFNKNVAWAADIPGPKGTANPDDNFDSLAALIEHYGLD